MARDLDDNVEKIAGHPARTCEQFTQANASAWKEDPQ